MVVCSVHYGSDDYRHCCRSACSCFALRRRGRFFLAIETPHAHRTQNAAYLNYLRDHAWFFILITVVYGAITGVRIWWTIGLASPLATEYLIRTFVFGGATEYVFFVIEIVAAFVFYYFWARLSLKTHIGVGWTYSLAA